LVFYDFTRISYIHVNARILMLFVTLEHTDK